MSKPTLNGELLHPSDYLAAVEFKGRDVTMTIASVKRDDLMMKGGKSETKPVLTFRERPKKLVLNKTNASIIADLYGTEATAWVGKRITLYPTKTQCGRATVDCIRVRETAPVGHQATAGPAYVPTEDERRAILEREAAEAGG